jgi:hypothetical protein
MKNSRLQVFGGPVPGKQTPFDPLNLNLTSALVL